MNYNEFNKKLDELIIYARNDNTSLKNIQKSLKLSLISIEICDNFGEN